MTKIALQSKEIFLKRKDEIDALIAVYEAHMPKTVYLMRNPGRYEQVVNAMDEIKSYISSIEESATFKITKDELVGTSLIMEVTCTLLSLSEVDQFCNAIKQADTIDFTPLASGDLSVMFGFNNAYIPVPPAAKKKP